jgi:MFS family permease
MCVLSLFCIYTILIHIVPHVIDLGFSASTAADVLATLGGVSIAGRLIMGGAVDRIGSRRALIIIFTILMAALCLLPYATALWMLYVFAALQGFAHGGFFSITSPTVADLFGTRYHGLILGIVIFSGTIGGSIGPILGGRIFDVTHSYLGLFRMLAVACVIALVLAATLRPMRRRRP